MSSPYVNVTVKEIYEALVKNGFEHIRGQWTATSADGTIKAACVLGQTAINLGVRTSFVTHSLAKQLDTILIPWSKVPDALKDVLYKDGDSGVGLGTILIFANDKEAPSGYGYSYSWTNLVKLARRLMEPHFDTTLKLKTYKFKLPKSMEESTNA